jgi:putative membrane-bound dehydrogenase-like protein
LLLIVPALFVVQVAAPARGDGPQTAAQTAAGLRVAQGLEATVFASEPMITNPTNLAVDRRGRVWVCDVVNYRGNQGKRPEGDRILILEDRDQDGAADEVTVFYQGPEVDSALGICVLGCRVIVSCSPNVWIFTDDDGDDRADRREALFTNTGDPQHDHSAHAFVFGPDGKLYWNLGNTNHGVFDRDGNQVLDLFGIPIRSEGKPFRHGMAFRCDLDGSHCEVLAHNLRNSYELTVDPFGTVWFTDNDDDGNRGTRVCETLEGGNYGYTDELTGRHWRDNPRTGMSLEIPVRHWHQNDPGSIPNLLQTGSGSPAGIALVEGNLLPAALRGQLVHCEPGHNLVRAYAVQGSLTEDGHQLVATHLVEGDADPWFRPVDIVTAADGSLLVADWYDPGVGGHRQADIDRGRIYRIAPPGMPYRADPVKLNSPRECVAALGSANQDVRYEAWTKLSAMGAQAEQALREALADGDPPQRALAVWLLARLPDEGPAILQQAATDANPNVRIVALRAARQCSPPATATLIDQLSSDPVPRVRRECAVELRRLRDDRAAERWARLAVEHETGQRWYLEALGLAAAGRWDECLAAWLELAGPEAWRTAAGREILWRSRGTQTFDRLTELLVDPSLTTAEAERLLRALDFNRPAQPNDRLAWLIEQAAGLPVQRRTLLQSEALRRWEGDVLGDAPLQNLLAILPVLPRPRAAEFIMRFRAESAYEELLQYALDAQTTDDRGAHVVQFFLREELAERLGPSLERSAAARHRMVRLLAESSDVRAVDLLMPIALRPPAVGSLPPGTVSASPSTSPSASPATASPIEEEAALRREAIRAIAANRQGAQRLVELAEAGDLDTDATLATVYALRATPFSALALRAAKLIPDLPVADEQPLPVSDWMRLAGRPREGEQLFRTKANCSTCHRAGEQGGQVGPSLAEVGDKLSRTGLFEALLYPSAAISHNYEAYVALTREGTAIQGIRISQTDDTITLRTDKGVDHELVIDTLDTLQKSTISLMPSGIEKILQPQELADLVAYLQTLRQRTPQ